MQHKDLNLGPNWNKPTAKSYGKKGQVYDLSDEEYLLKGLSL